jgi:hypothetical protein
VNAVAILDRFSRIAPLGVRLRDVATGRIAMGQFEVTAAPPGGGPQALARNGLAVWIAVRLPGLRDADLDPATSGSTPVRSYALSVDDPGGEFLPLRLNVVLPRRGLYTWDGWSALPPALLAPLRDEPGGEPCPDALPLFSAPARAAPLGCAALRGQLRRLDNDQPAAWTLIAVRQDGERGLGLSDAEGRFVVFMPWPEWPRATLPMLSPPGAASPAPAGSTAPSWTLEFSAYSALLPPSPVPSLPEVMGQLAVPHELFASTQSPLEPLAPKELQFGCPLTLRTDRTPNGPSSFLIMAAA